LLSAVAGPLTGAAAAAAPSSGCYMSEEKEK
jgi:hypothetical protein